MSALHASACRTYAPAYSGICSSVSKWRHSLPQHHRLWSVQFTVHPFCFFSYGSSVPFSQGEFRNCGPSSGLLYKYQGVCNKVANEVALPEYVARIGKDFECVCSPDMTFGQYYAYVIVCGTDGVKSATLQVYLSKSMTANVSVSADR